LLPNADDPMEDSEIRYIWGIWFQVIYVLARCGLTQEGEVAVGRALRVLKARGYLDKFIAELDYPDYSVMRPVILRGL
jgi:hypothetical protein